MTDYSGAIKKLLPQLVERRAEIEESRRLPADLATALQKTGIFALAVPRAIGGGELPATDLMQIVETVAAADGSSGWLAMIGILSNVSAGYMNEPGAKELFGDPTIQTAGVAAPIGTAVRVDGGLRITGRWPFASGITASELVWAGAIVHEGGAPVMTPHGPEIVHAWMPASAVAVHDTWRVTGLAGTGSNDFSCEEVFVPDHLVWSLFDPSGHRPEPLYQYPAVAAFATLASCVGLGVARAALDELTGLAAAKVPTLSQAVLADKAVAQVDIAKAEGRLGAARSFLYDTVDDLWQTLSAGRPPTERQRALARIAPLTVVESTAEVTRTANVLAGGGAIFSATSIQRHARDAEALLHHFTVAQHVWEDAGRVLLGRAPKAPIF